MLRLWSGMLWRNLADLQAKVCRLVVGHVTRAQWEEVAPGIPYHATCAS
jgi:hypothetical protein